jgi:iron complex outermembrane recepter protein
LMPSFTQNVELNYIYKNNLGLILSASKSTDNSGYVTIFDDGTNIEMPQNYYNQTRVGLDISYRFKPAKWWTIFTSGNINHNKSQTFLTDLQIPDVSGFASSTRIGNTFTLNSKRTSFFALNYNQNFPSQNGLLKIKSYGYLSANLRFSLINDNLSFMISTLDPFKQNIMVSEMKYNTYKSASKFNSRMQNVLITATYSFGNERVKNVNRQSKNTESQRAQ